VLLELAFICPALATRSGAAPYNPMLATLGGYAYMLNLAFTPLVLGIGNTLGGCASNWHPSIPALATRSGASPRIGFSFAPTLATRSGAALQIPALATRLGASPRIGIYSTGVSNTLGGCT
jgi:hypothetical protein